MLNKRIASVLVASMVMVSMVGCSKTVKINIDSYKEPIYKTSIKSEKSLSKDDYEFAIDIYDRYERIKDEYNEAYIGFWDDNNYSISMEDARNKAIYELRDLQLEVEKHEYANTKFSIELVGNLRYIILTAIQDCECGIDIDIIDVEEWVLDNLNMLNRAIVDNDFSEKHFDKLADEFRYQE